MTRKQSGDGTGVSRRQALGWTARGGAALAGAALIGGVGTPGQTRTVSAQQNEAIAGSWVVTATDDNAQGPPNTFLATFAGGGGYIQSSSPGQSTGHGAWAANADGSFGLTFQQAFFQPMSQDTPPLVLTVVASLQLGADNNTLSGHYRFTITQADGSPVPAGAGGGQPTSGTGTANGTRIQVQSL